MLYESAEALPLVYSVDNLATARAEQARSPAQLNAIRGEDSPKDTNSDHKRASGP